jgi:hypothetical protein
MGGFGIADIATEVKREQSTENYTHLTVKEILKCLLLLIMKQLCMYYLSASYVKTKR